LLSNVLNLPYLQPHPLTRNLFVYQHLKKNIY
jgi:hypothetical protein